MISRIEIENFRGFSHLELDDLKPVNLIVGRNNSGKTSLLEAINFVLEPEKSANTFSRYRGEGPPNEMLEWLVKKGAEYAAVRISDNLLHGDSSVIFIKNGAIARIKKESPDIIADHKMFQEYAAGIVYISKVGHKHDFWPTATANRLAFCPTTRPNKVTIVKLFSEATKMKGGEETIEAILHDIDPRITKARLALESGGNIIEVDVGLDERVPLDQVGQGIASVVSIMSLIIGSGARYCILDEIENGIHHTAFRPLWKGIASAARRAGIQIFATTHSWECLEEAHQVFSEEQDYDFSVIQLFRVEEREQGRVLGKELIEAAIAGDIDLR